MLLYRVLPANKYRTHFVKPHEIVGLVKIVRKPGPLGECDGKVDIRRAKVAPQIARWSQGGSSCPHRIPVANLNIT